MIKLITFIVILMSVIGYTAVSSQRNYNHKNAILNAEFDNVYVQLESVRYYRLRTTAELITMIPRRRGESYFNTTTNELWISTGTAVNQFVHK